MPEPASLVQLNPEGVNVLVVPVVPVAAVVAGAPGSPPVHWND